MLWENEGITSLEPEEGTEGVVGHDLLEKEIAQGIFEAVLDPEILVNPEVLADDVVTIGLGILDCCDLFGVLDDVIPTLIVFALANCCLPKKNKYLRLYLLFT